MENPKKKYSLFRLIRELPGQLIELLKAEIARAKLELVRRLKTIGIGVGLLAGAAIFAFWLVAVLITAAILGLAVVVPPWLAALIVAALVIGIIAVLVAMGVRQLKKGSPPVPEETIESVKEDVRVVKGMGVDDDE